MFGFVDRCWNPITGCEHNCHYCWARKLALGKLKDSSKYREGFKPKITESDMSKHFKDGECVFVSDMGDMWGEWVPDEWIERVLRRIADFPNTKFLFLTKNPVRYIQFVDRIPNNCVLGATIESNVNYIEVSKAPLQTDRILAMATLKGHTNLPRFVNIEPIMRFTTGSFAKFIIEEITPESVAIGYDNYSNKLEEPYLEDTLNMIGELEKVNIKVHRKTLRERWDA